ncbi:hypothetical protein Nepgr_019219 [Nepenthes gracilis]|uniref:Uncharacterized protein n=1 Tax=Nepenthes gracilis TaxID=150966 RepID=A0AAD3STN0_NEPGR|nr:hypothetical protein Nepgr_019219 [Nepenthes gracilis]
MAESIGVLNPPKILNAKLGLPTLPSICAYNQRKPRIKQNVKFPKFCSSTVSTSNYQTAPLIDELNHSNHKEEVLEVIKGSLSNCLSETNLHLTVPGLKSKIRERSGTYMKTVIILF